MEITKIRKCVRKVGNEVECTQKPTKTDIKNLAKKISKELDKRGISCGIETPATTTHTWTDDSGEKHSYTRSTNVKGNTIKISGCKITEPYAKKYGKNVGGHYKAKRTHHMNWEDWVEFNDAVNDVLDESMISANAQSLKGQFVQRKGMERMSRDDWEGGYHQNVGSMMQPQSRGEFYESEGRGREGWREDREKKVLQSAERQKKKEQAIKEKYPSVRVAKAHKKMYGKY